ncbi:MAG: class I SAM-dependent methyltransferase [Chloroflexi bacterium]|nr:class I SAM-dependent methyltransferase [Chloroflexota bacterium]MCI0647702.1 class I SAM-dependent methyltransferase [Chloroflexota bacterium]MCI0726569.1 class I SAM-dependent methyltransferase [Chloroflexota bacterium]
MTTTLQTKQPAPKAAKPYKGMAMEGVIAKWYTKIREQDQELETAVRQVNETLPAAGRVLEVAPGPGYLAIELAKAGKYQVVGLDISQSFVQIAQAKAREAGVPVDFRHGNASDMPFEAGVFDFIICRAAFKNFSEPVQAIREMYRVLKPGGRALIADLRRDVSLEDINTHVNDLGLSRINTFITRWTFKHMLLKNAYTPEEIRQFVAQTSFAKCEIREDAVGMEIWLEK